MIEFLLYILASKKYAPLLSISREIMKKLNGTYIALVHTKVKTMLKITSFYLSFSDSKFSDTFFQLNLVSKSTLGIIN